MNDQLYLDVHEKPKNPVAWLFMSLQHVFAMFGATVLGGMTIILYGLIAGNGVKILVKEKVNFTNMKNLIIAGAMLVIGLGGATIQLNSAIGLSGMSLAALVGIILNLILNPEKDEK